jgi:hypothetical protein
MRPEIERLRELGGLIRAGHAELGRLQLQLMEAYERQFNPAQLGVRIADLGREITAWKHEQKALLGRVALGGASESESIDCSFCSEPSDLQRDEKDGVKQPKKRTGASGGVAKGKHDSS